jgi:GH24 family phage-related lysozyme (muramidase)
MPSSNYYNVYNRNINMNRKFKLKLFYKIATNTLDKNAGIKETMIGGAAALGLGAGILSHYMNTQDDVPEQDPQVVETVEETPQELGLINYKLKPNENIHDICRSKFKGYVDKAEKYIMEINELDENKARKLRAGKIIKIPVDLTSFIDHFDLAENEKFQASVGIKEYIKRKESGQNMEPLLEPRDIEGKGIKTIGHGHRLETPAERSEYEDIKKRLKRMGRKDGRLSPQDNIILIWLERDVKEAEDKIKFKALPALNQNQFDALVSFTFNTGGVPDIKDLLISGDIAGAANKIRTDKSADMDGFGGLAPRRSEEAALFEKPI